MSEKKQNKSRRLHTAFHYGKGIIANVEIYIPSPKGPKNADGTQTQKMLDKLEFLRVLKGAVDEAVLMGGGETRWYNGGVT